MKAIAISIMLSFLLLLPSCKLGYGLPHYDASGELKVLSWNIHTLPSMVYHKTRKMTRAGRIGEELLQRDYNIIVFQEAFHRRARKRILKHLGDKYPFRYGPANKTRFISTKASSGLWILSDRPLVHLDEIAYSNCEGDGCMARKGALMMLGEHRGHRFQIIGTHNNNGPMNNSQFLEIRHHLLDKYHEEGVPQIICGDFNTHKGSPNQQWETMLRLFGIPLDFEQEDGRSQQDLEAWGHNDIHRMPDFIFVRENGDSLLQVKRTATISIGPTWRQGEEKVYLETVGLSDHFPVELCVGWR